MGITLDTVDAEETARGQTPAVWRTAGGKGEKTNGPALLDLDEPDDICHSVDLWTSPSASGASFPVGTPAPETDNTGAGESISLETSGTNFANVLFAPNSAIAETIAQKLESQGLHDYAEKLRRCHQRWTVLRCKQCGRRYRFPERCKLRFCPNCQHFLSKKRQQDLEWWVRMLKQPKHVVLTVRNAGELTPDYIKWVKKCFSRLRRRRFAKGWKSGIYSIEVTNEGRGWHVHLHALIEAQWIDAKELARQWADIVGQDFAIVWVKDARGKETVKEILKYAVKGNQVAEWTPEEVAQYVRSVEGVRLFGRFGSLTGELERWKEETEDLVEHGFRCECGSEDFDVIRDLDYLTALKLAKGPPEAWDQYLNERLIEEVVSLLD
ncbi:MAG: protein rep [Candidatus Hydrothermae bacterium]|nr:protein rep [Candidatus Hydrothermae bacterium]